MPRWQLDGRGRLQDAALALFAERGYTQTTIAAITQRARLNERTFFRHFPDKRDVLFGNEDRLQHVLVQALSAAPAAAPPITAASAALLTLAAELQPWREQQQQRARVVASSPELRERELAKLDLWSGALTGALQQRGETEQVAHVVAAMSLAVFSVAYQRWTRSGDHDDLPALVSSALDRLPDLIKPLRSPAPQHGSDAPTAVVADRP